MEEFRRIWFKRESDNSDNTTNHGISNVLLGHSAGDSNDDYELGTEGNALEGYLDTGGNDASWSPVDVGVENGTRHHVATTYDQTAENELKIYFDGELAQELSEWGGLLDGDEPTQWTFGIARPESDMWGDFEGRMDDAVILSRALSTRQIKALHEGDAGPLLAVPEPAGPPQLGISRSEGNVEIKFDKGALQTAPSIMGPWSEATQTSPATFPIEGQSQFFRVLPQE